MENREIWTAIQGIKIFGMGKWKTLKQIKLAMCFTKPRVFKTYEQWKYSRTYVKHFDGGPFTQRTDGVPLPGIELFFPECRPGSSRLTDGIIPVIDGMFLNSRCWNNIDVTFSAWCTRKAWARSQSIQSRVSSFLFHTSSYLPVFLTICCVMQQFSVGRPVYRDFNKNAVFRSDCGNESERFADDVYASKTGLWDCGYLLLHTLYKFHCTTGKYS
jgi:hypothetical protein